MAALFPAERRDFCPLIGHLGGKRGVETADNEMDVCRHVCGRIFEGEDDDVRVEGSTVFFFFHAKKNAGICGFLWGWVIDASC